MKGLYENVPIEEYHAHEAVSNSKLGHYVDSPVDYCEYYITKKSPPPPIGKKSAYWGDLIDTLLTEPHTFESRYAVAPEDFPKKPSESSLNAANPSTNADIEHAKGLWLPFLEEHAGKTLLTAEDYERACELVDTGMRRPEFAAALNGCDLRQPTIRLTLNTRHGEPLPFEMQCRPDLMCTAAKEEIPLKDTGEKIRAGECYLVDVKTTANLRCSAKTNFISQICNYGYDRGAMLNSMLVQKCLGLDYLPRYLFAFIQKEKPYQAGMFDMSYHWRSEALSRLNILLDCDQAGYPMGLKQRYERNCWDEWPPGEVYTLEPPYWHISPYDPGGVA